MKSLIPFLIVIGLLGGGGAMLYIELQTKFDAAEYDAKLKEQRLKFAQHSVFTRSVADDQVAFERGRLMDWHVKAIKKIAKEHPESSKELRFMDNLKVKAEKDKKAKAKLATYQERYAWLDGVWQDTLKRGDYEPLLTQAKNGVRYDVVNILPVAGKSAGKKALQMDLLLWGPVKEHVGFGALTIQFVREIETTDKRGKIKKKVALVKIEGGGPPEILHPSGSNPDPAKWIDAWPPGVMVGYFRGLPLFPHDATKFSLKMELQIRTYAQATTTVEFEWKNIEVKPEWKAPEGETFDAQVTEASEAELEAAGIKID
jgi:hypothetical protein